MQIGHIRKQKGLTQKELAGYVGISRESLARIENGTRNPSLKTITKIAAILECKIDELVSDERDSA